MVLLPNGAECALHVINVTLEHRLSQSTFSKCHAIREEMEAGLAFWFR
jgi:hypothetical protein